MHNGQGKLQSAWIAVVCAVKNTTFTHQSNHDCTLLRNSYIGELFHAASPYGLIQDSLLPRGKADALWDIKIILQIFGADLSGDKQVGWAVIFQLKVAGGVCVPWLDVIKNCAWLTWNSTNVHQKKCGSLYSNTQPGLWKLHLASTQPACRGARKRKRKKKLTAIQRGYKASVDKLLHILLPLIILNSFNESLSK